jgi:hypothetical protein
VPFVFFRVVVQSSFKKKEMKFIMGGLLHIFQTLQLLHSPTSPTIRHRIYLQLPASYLAIPINVKKGNIGQSSSMEVP